MHGRGPNTGQKPSSIRPCLAKVKIELLGKAATLYTSEGWLVGHCYGLGLVRLPPKCTDATLLTLGCQNSDTLRDSASNRYRHRFERPQVA